MKRNKVSLALTAAVSLASTYAMALPLSQYNPTGPGTVRVFVSGSSTQDASTELWFRLQCTPGTLDIYRVGSDQRLFFCNIPAPSGVNGLGALGFSGQKVAFFKSSVVVRAMVCNRWRFPPR